MKDIRSMDLNLLKALDALLDECNVTRAATRLGLTQPAMSGMLTRLRESFGDPLFARAQRGMVPTQRALDLGLPIKQVLAEIDALLQPPVFDPTTARLTFTIASTDYALHAIAVPFLSALKPLAPHIRVALVPVKNGQVQAQLERGQISLALLSPENTPPDLHARELFRERYVCVLREGHPVAKGRKLTLKQFCALDHALASYEGGGFHGVTDEALEKLGMRREVTVSVKSFLILPDILRASDMVAILPSRLVAGMEGLVVSAPPLEVPGFSKTAVWHERTHHDPAHRWLRELLFKTCADRR
ncbi:LysR family transcriptional regulator [Acidovorax sp. Be4]|jgi:DNA-binding transcriptional LysR family regulator|uniref:LysR family transcriptional regulator n=1 Tax=Acidovorax bellezanensis TaxID=2976702 RepID=A0ABT2PNC7_9BURK|nr:LysR family transcriptional regulator [Acidovorax sp. Be4]MCT9811976.1 LysR family transcriptional regulator [Acidovorax sp. Be4]